MDEWVVWFYVEPFTLDLSRNRDKYPIVLASVPVADSARVHQEGVWRERAHTLVASAKVTLKEPVRTDEQ